MSTVFENILNIYLNQKKNLKRFETQVKVDYFGALYKIYGNT
jgi:hypothetical protein